MFVFILFTILQNQRDLPPSDGARCSRPKDVEIPRQCHRPRGRGHRSDPGTAVRTAGELQLGPEGD